MTPEQIAVATDLATRAQNTAKRQFGMFWIFVTSATAPVRVVDELERVPEKAFIFASVTQSMISEQLCSKEGLDLR